MASQRRGKVRPGGTGYSGWARGTVPVTFGLAAAGNRDSGFKLKGPGAGLSQHGHRDAVTV
eukprot:1076223-Rhodomonas_salina.2